MDRRGHLKPLADQGHCTVARDLAGVGNAPDRLGVGSTSLFTDAQTTHINSLLPIQGTPLLCLGAWGGLPRCLRRECLEDESKSKDRLEDWGIKTTRCSVQSSPWESIEHSSEQFSFIGKKPSFTPPCTLLAPGVGGWGLGGQR